MGRRRTYSLQGTVMKEKKNDKIMNSIDELVDVLISQEFNGLSPLETLLKIFKENKKAKEIEKTRKEE